MKGVSKFQKQLRDMPLELFIDLFCTVFNPEIAETIPFKLWPEQGRLCRFFEYWRSKFHLEFIFPKARQNGISEIASSLALQECMSYDNTLILCISSNEDKAKEFLKKRFLSKYENLPKGLPWPKIVRPTMTEVEFSNGSRFMSLPASDTAGQSFTGTGVILDECGAIDKNTNASFDAIYTNVAPAIEKAGKRGWLLQIGTSEVGTAYNEKVKRVVDGEDLYTKMFFIGWKADPSRDEAWYQRTRMKSSDEASFKTQYPETIDDFFVVKEGLVVPQFDYTENGRHVREFMPPDYFKELYFGYDHGYRHPSVLLTVFYETTTGIFYFWDEWYRSDMSVYDKGIEMKKIMKATELEFKLQASGRIADTVIFKKDRGSRSLAQEFMECGITFSQAKKHGGLSGSNSSLEKLRRLFHTNKILIHPRCQRLIQDLKTWKYKKGLKEEIEDIHDDGPDVMRYIIEAVIHKDPTEEEMFKATTGYSYENGERTDDFWQDSVRSIEDSYNY